MADDPDGDLLAFLDGERMAGVAVNAAERFVVNFRSQSLLGFLLGGGFGQVAQATFPFVEFSIVLPTVGVEVTRL